MVTLSLFYQANQNKEKNQFSVELQTKEKFDKLYGSGSTINDQ